MKNNKYQRQKYTFMNKYKKIRTQIKAKTKTKSSSGKKKNTWFLIRVKTRALFANKNEYISSKRNLLGSNHLLQQTKQTNKEN
jgi:hypothetical protein